MAHGWMLRFQDEEVRGMLARGVGGVGNRRSVRLAVHLMVILELGGDSEDLARGKETGRPFQGLATGQVIPADLATEPE